MSRKEHLHIRDEKIKKFISEMAMRRGVSMKEMVRIIITAWKKQNDNI